MCVDAGGLRIEGIERDLTLGLAFVVSSYRLVLAFVYSYLCWVLTLFWLPLDCISSYITYVVTWLA